MSGTVDLICLSHLRWNFVYQRPNHLMSRCAKERRVFFVEEPLNGVETPDLEISEVEPNLYRVTPHLPSSFRDDQRRISLSQLIDELIDERHIREYALWFYTPMALEFCGHLRPAATIYDCMDELSAFAGAPKILRDYEAELFKRARPKWARSTLLGKGCTLACARFFDSYKLMPPVNTSCARLKSSAS